MDHFEVKRALASMVILVDTREQDTPRLRKRLRAMDCPIERRTLKFGDYSAKCTLPDGGELQFSYTLDSGAETLISRNSVLITVEPLKKQETEVE